MKRGYIRISSVGQKIDRQEEQLKEHVDEMYVDTASGSSRNGRKELERLIRDLKVSDEVIILSIDRLARSTLDLLTIVNEIKEKGATLKSIQDTWLDTNEENPMGDFLLTVMAALAEMERKQINKRAKDGIEVARQKGVKFGRPKANPKRVEHALQLYDAGMHTVKEIENLTNVSKATIYRRIQKRDV